MIYTIGLNSSDCITNNLLPITLVTPPHFPLDSFTILPSYCLENKLGSISRIDTGSGALLETYDASLLDENGILLGVSPTRTVTFDNLSSGDYSLEISQYLGICEQTIDFSIDSIPCINQNLTDGYAVINPNSTFDKIDFVCGSKVYIYNRNSKLIRTLTNVNSWDGTLENGQIAPTGLYILFCKNQRLGEVTVIQE